MPPNRISPRVTTGVRAAALALVLAAFGLVLWHAPIPLLAARLQEWLEGLGLWGPVAFAAIYVLVTVLALPGSAFTLLGGALFGLWQGTLAVSIGATVGAALTFLIGRYLARERVAAFLARRPALRAIDQALGEGSWRMVLLLRLSPAVPFNVQNYLYGLTAIRFWPCVVASWVGMLPGTFLYVYIGHLAGTAVSTGRARTPAEWAMLAAGLLATVALTVYLTRLARRRLKAQAPIEPAAPEPAASTARWPWGATVAGLLALLVIAATLVLERRPGVVSAWFGPPAATLEEAYAADEQGTVFDHSAFDRLLREHVIEGGWVDYAALRENEAALDAYLAQLADAPFEDLARDEKLALLINAYNACTLKLILDHWPIASIQDIPASERWTAQRWEVGGRILSLDDLEHREIRPKFREPRIHFALVCAAVGCPPLRAEAYTGARLEAQLDAQTRYTHTHPRWFQWFEDGNTVGLTKLYDWYAGDFEQIAGSVLTYAAQYAPPLAEALESDKTPAIRWLDYDWQLNDVKNKP